MLLVLLGFYFTCNFICSKLQELIFQFVEEFALGLRHPTKSVRYRTACMCMLLVVGIVRVKNKYECFNACYMCCLKFLS